MPFRAFPFTDTVTSHREPRSNEP